MEERDLKLMERVCAITFFSLPGPGPVVEFTLSV